VNDLASFARLLDALHPWTDQLVIVGGWAHRLHRFHPLAHPPTYEAIRTKDADLAFSSSAPIDGDIAAALKNASFVEELSGEEMPPVTQYRLGTDDEGFFAEFLTPLHGSGTKRSGRPDATVATAGITAQKLRHLELLLVRPWSLRLSNQVGVPVRDPVAINLANPVSFIAQKLLIQKHRKPNKQAQDVLYLHDTLELFGGELAVLRKLWNEEVRPTLPETTARTVDRLQRDYFGSISDVIRNAARIPQDRVVTPERMQALCSFGLQEIFGPP
jgi:hypothetical protein